MKTSKAWNIIMFLSVMVAAVFSALSVELFRAYTVYFLGMILAYLFRMGDKK